VPTCVRLWLRAVNKDATRLEVPRGATDTETHHAQAILYAISHGWGVNDVIVVRAEASDVKDHTARVSCVYYDGLTEDVSYDEYPLQCRLISN